MDDIATIDVDSHWSGTTRRMILRDNAAALDEIDVPSRKRGG